MNSAEYDKIISDSIEKELTDHDKMNDIPTETILRHLLGRSHGYGPDSLLEDKWNSFYDVSGNIHRIKITMD